MPRGFLVFALCLPLAVLLGFMLSDPLMGKNMMIVSGAIFVLLIPLMLRIHHRALIWCAFAYVMVFFIPGQPHLWMVLAALSFTISVLSRPLAKVKARPVWDPLVMGSLVFIALLALFTARETGGIGMRVLGSGNQGGRKYVFIFAAIIGCFALTMQRLPRVRAHKDIAAYLLAPITAAVGNVAYALGPKFYFLFLLFPVEWVISQAAADYDVTGGLKRLAGFGPLSTAISTYCLMKWGLRGILQIRKTHRLFLLLIAIGLGMFSGFRSTVAIFALVTLFQFFAEGLYRTRYAAGALAVMIASFTFVAVFAESLPLAVQRTISFLPVRVDPMAAADAKASIEWRLEMWKTVSKEIPKYFWIGKGYSVDPTDLYLAEESMRRGFASGYDFSIEAGDYHSGPLSVIIPFGIFGVLGFLAFCIASLRVLWKNMRYSDPDIKNINTFFFAYFAGRLLFFLLFFGSLESDLWLFTSVVGISLTLNGGVKVRSEKPRLKFEQRSAREREAEPALI